MTIDFLDGLLDLSPVSEMSARSPGTNQYSPISALAIQMLSPENSHVARLFLRIARDESPARCLFPREIKKGPSLHLKEISFDEMHAILVSWDKLSRDKQELVESAKEWDQFETNREVCQDFLKKLNLGDRSQFYLCQVGDDPKAVMATKDFDPSSLEIVYLITNPINIRSSVNDSEENRVKGAGTFLLQEAEKIAVVKKMERVVLSSLSTAVEFYKKNGYVSCGNSSYMERVIQND